MLSKTPSDVLWLLFCTSLVFIMQAGFLCLEAGLTRSKNSINVAIKNLMTFGIVSLVFWFWGFGLSYGESFEGWMGINLLFADFKHWSAFLSVFFVYQLMFCATSAVIISGAVAERIRFSSYLAIVLVAAGVIYPILNHWVNNGAIVGERLGWLGKIGFLDFAGSTTVHSVGGWISLAAVLVIGPRRGRFSKDGKSQEISGSNLPFAILGCVLLFFGWIGFNGGSTLSFSENVPRIVTNTLLAGATGMITGLLFSWKDSGRPHIVPCLNGTLAALVAITASSNMVYGTEVIFIAVGGSMASFYTDKLLEHYRLDDALGAVGVHLSAGIWGTLAVAFFGESTEFLNQATRWKQFEVQAAGVIATGLWSFGVAYLFLKIFDRFFPLRVSEANEELGLNVSEHEAQTEWVTLLAGMDSQIKSKNWKLRMPEEAFTEVGQIAQKYNSVLGAFEQSLVAGQMSAQLASLGQMAGGIAHEINNPLMIIQTRADQLQRLSLKGLLLPERLKEISEDISSTTERMARIVQSLSNVARGNKQNPMEKVSLKSLLADIVNLSQSKFISKGIGFFPPDSFEDIRLNCNAVEISQILLNFLNNAMDAVSELEEKWVRLELHSENTAVKFFVIDSGKGIPSELREKIFEAFYTTKSIGKGTGLGLSLCRSFAENNNGKVYINSEFSNTCFVLELPKESNG